MMYFVSPVSPLNLSAKTGGVVDSLSECAR
jgi:hypothetical protein